METTSYNIRKNSHFFLYVILVAFAITYFSGCGGKTHYEEGSELLRDKQYTEALEEFQKVDPDESYYRMAQSKINYIHGLRAFNDSLMSEAQSYLVKVETDDEYYHDTQLMLEKINQSLAYHQSETAALATNTGTDTTIIREQIVQQTPPPTEKREPMPTDRQINRTHASQLESIINKFEISFQSGRNAPVASKSSFLATMRSIEREFHNLTYTSNDPGVIELRRLISSWMNKRMAFVNLQISENTVGETETSRQIRVDGDNLYYTVNNQLRQVKSVYVD